MSCEAVKFINKECLVKACHSVPTVALTQIDNPQEYRRFVRETLGKLLGQSFIARADISELQDGSQGDTIFQTEVYVFTPNELRRLYSLMYDEMRRERKK